MNRDSLKLGLEKSISTLAHLRDLIEFFDENDGKTIADALRPVAAELNEVSGAIENALDTKPAPPAERHRPGDGTKV